MSAPTLLIAPVSYAAAKHAVMTWHYSKAMPSGKLVRFGVWEDGEYIGAVLYGRGGAPNIGKPYALAQTEVCELVRVALREHAAPVTQIVAQTLRQLAATSPGLRLVVSYADPAQGHHGGIYQAGGWTYLGRTKSTPMFVDARGKVHHSRVVSPSGFKRQFGRMKPVLRSDEATRIIVPGKHKYVFPLDRAMRRRIAKLARPYPPRGQGVHGDTSGVLPGEPSSSLGDRS